MTSCMVTVYTEWRLADWHISNGHRFKHDSRLRATRYNLYIDAVVVLADMFCVLVCVGLCFNVSMILKIMWKFKLYYQRLRWHVYVT